jgi:hypothetical protein
MKVFEEMPKISIYMYVSTQYSQQYKCIPTFIKHKCKLGKGPRRQKLKLLVITGAVAELFVNETNVKVKLHEIC